MSNALHLPVLFHDLFEAAQPQSGQKWVDGTFGRGGHTRGFLTRGCHVLALDRDAEASAFASALATEFPNQLTFQQTNFSQMKTACTNLGWNQVDGVLLDLGVSSPQLDTPARGFSFRLLGDLDMRMDQSQSLTAAQLVNQLPESELADLFYQLGDEHESRRVARGIVRRRASAPFTTTVDLAETIAASVSPSRRHGKTHPATKAFQALRIAVNAEMESLQDALPVAVDLLAPGGILAVISFHSGEDRYVKNYLRNHWRPNSEEVSYPILFQKVERFLPSDEEMETNPRCRSARLRMGWKKEVEV